MSSNEKKERNKSEDHFKSRRIAAAIEEEEPPEVIQHKRKIRNRSSLIIIFGLCLATVPLMYVERGPTPIFILAYPTIGLIIWVCAIICIIIGTTYYFMRRNAAENTESA